MNMLALSHLSIISIPTLHMRKHKKTLFLKRVFSFRTEEEGFEPPRGVTRLSVFKTDPFSRTWVFLQMVDPVGLEPTTNRL